jgi:tubulin-specific chaperone A
MPPPSQLSIVTSSVQRLVKEESSYHRELEKQVAHLEQLEATPSQDENAEYQLKQEVCYYQRHPEPHHLGIM